MKHSIKLYIFALPFSFFACQSNSQIIEMDEVHEHSVMRGPVKKIELNTYNPIVNGELKKGKLNNGNKKLLSGGGEWIFNENGTIQNQISYENGSTYPKYYFEYTHDSNKKLVKRTDYDSPVKKHRILEIEYEYDSDGNLTMTQYFNDAICESKELMLTSKDVFEYNSHNDITKQIDSTFYNYDCDEIDVDVTIHEYNPEYNNGLKIADDTFNYEYDGKGNMIKKIDKKNPPIYYEYYSSGVRKKKFLDVDNYDDYDEDGYLIKSTSPVRGGFVFKMEYSQRDNYDNWTRMVIYRDNEPYLIGERTFTYY